MKRLISIAVLTGLIVATGAVRSHGEANPDSPAHGGQIRVAGVYHYELVVAKDAREEQDSPVVVYITDGAGKKLSTVGATGTATLLAGKLKATAALQPDGDNRMKGVAKYAATPDLKVVVLLTLPGKPAEQARFTPLADTK